MKMRPLAIWAHASLMVFGGWLVVGQAEADVRFRTESEKARRVDQILEPWKGVRRWRLEYETRPLSDVKNISPSHHVTAAAEPGEYHHLGAHSAPYSWESDPFSQALFIHEGMGCNVWPNKRIFSEQRMIPGQFMPDATVQDMMVLLTLSWPLTEYKMPEDASGRIIVPEQAMRSSAYRLLELSEKVSGYECDVFSRDGVDPLWLSREPGPCVMKREFHDPRTGRLLRRLVVDRLTDAGHGRWLPKVMRNQRFNNESTEKQGVPEHEIEVTILAYGFDDQVPRSVFVPSYRPGTLRFVGAKFNQVSAGGTDLLDEYVNFVVRYLRLGPPGWTRFQNLVWLVFGTACGLLVSSQLFLPRARLPSLANGEENTMDNSRTTEGVRRQ